MIINEKVPYFNDDWHEGMSCSETTMRMMIEKGLIDLPVESVKLFSGLNGAMGYNANCGAVNAAVAAIGYYFGRFEPGHNNEAVYRLEKEFMDLYNERAGSVKCEGIVTDGDYTSYKSQYRCTELILFALETVERLINEEKHRQKNR